MPVVQRWKANSEKARETADRGVSGGEGREGEGLLRTAIPASRHPATPAPVVALRTEYLLSVCSSLMLHGLDPRMRVVMPHLQGQIRSIWAPTTRPGVPATNPVEGYPASRVAAPGGIPARCFLSSEPRESFPTNTSYMSQGLKPQNARLPV